MPEARDGNSKKPLAVFNQLTVRELKKAWYGLKNIAGLGGDEAAAPVLHLEDREYIRSLIGNCVRAGGGEVSARSRTVELGTFYLNLSEDGRLTFYDILAHDFDVDKGVLEEKLDAYRKAGTDEEKIRGEMELKAALVPPRSRLLKQFSSLPNGIKFLIDIRADLLLRAGDNAALYKLSEDIREILSSWFDVGLLELKEITWSSPAALLEKLIEYEAVHEMRSWEDLKFRLASDRLCYAFFHNKMPEEPLIFVEVALVDELSSNIQELLKRTGRKEGGMAANTAVFYSITNAQQGLTGIHLGSFLIKSVVEKLSSEREHIKHFATLSPAPGFRTWIDAKLEETGEGLLTREEIRTLKSRCQADDCSGKIAEMLSAGWADDGERAGFLEPILLRLCAVYLMKERKGDRALDPVAHFHLNNGARLERLNWMANVSEEGMNSSYGIMVNYVYETSEIEKNHEKYMTEQEVAASRSVKGLLRRGWR